MDGLIVFDYLVRVFIRCGRLSIWASRVLLANRWPFSASSNRAEVAPRQKEREIVEFGHFAFGFVSQMGEEIYLSWLEGYESQSWL